MRIVVTLLAVVLAVTTNLKGAATRSLLQGGCSGIDVTAEPYGADPTGNANSAPAFNAAIAAATGRTVCVPSGTYAVTEDVNINNNGVQLNAPSGATIVFKNNVQLFIRGNANSVSNINVDCSGTAFSGFVIQGNSNSITGSSASNCGVHGFAFDGQGSGCNGNRISGSTATNNGQIGFSQNHCNGNVISGNTATSNGFEGITADNQSNGAQITGNTLTGNSVNGGVGSIGTDFSNGVIVTGNLIQGTQGGRPGLKTQNNLGSSNGLSVTNNQFLNNQGVAVWLYCNNGRCATGATVSGNTLSGNAATGNFCGGQVQVDNPRQVAVSCA